MPFSGCRGAREQNVALQREGGPAHASAAVVWDEALQPLVHARAKIGSDRRPWVDIQSSHGKLHIACVYLPPVPKHGPDEVRHAELDGFARDHGAFHQRAHDKRFLR